MKRKRNDSTTTGISPLTSTICNKILYLQIGSHVEVQREDGKWHSAIIVQCQPRKYLVEVEQQQYWSDVDLIRPNTILDQKRTAPFEYRPGQFLRNETKSPTKIVSDEKVLSCASTESPIELKKKRFSRSATEQKKCPFVWKPNTLSTIQTRRSSKTGQLSGVSPQENCSTENPCQKSSNIIKCNDEIGSSEVVIFRPIIRFVESDIDVCEQQTNQQHQIDGELRNCKSSLHNCRIVNEIHVGNDSRSSSRTSTDNLYLVQSDDCLTLNVEQTIKGDCKPSCFLETPPPSLPDIHLTQECECPSDKPHQQLKSKRKQDRPQRKQFKSFLVKPDGEQCEEKQINDRLVLKEKDEGDLLKRSVDVCDPAYLSDEYSEPMTSNEHLLTCAHLQHFYEQLEQMNVESIDESSSIVVDDRDKMFQDEFLVYLDNHFEHYQQIDEYRQEYYNEENNRRTRLISNILKEIFSLAFSRKLLNVFHLIPQEIKRHIKFCFNNVQHQHLTKTKIHTRRKRLTTVGHKNRVVKTKKCSNVTSITNCLSIIDDCRIVNDEQIFFSLSSPLTPISTGKLVEQQSTEHLLSPNTNGIEFGVIEQISILPKERDVYEIIHCLCQCAIDNGFMIQCETCFCWSHCECVGVTATCIPALFKCNICTKAEVDRTRQWSSLVDDETTSLFLFTPTNSNKISLFLSYYRRLWELREQITELKLRSTPKLRSLQFAFRSDDLIELCKFTNMPADELTRKMGERQKNREHFECVIQSVDEIVDCVCSSTCHSSCLAIELTERRQMVTKSRSLSDPINVLLCHLCDDDEIRQIRLSIQSRYDEFMSVVDQQIENILHEHQSIEKEMEFELSVRSCCEQQFDISSCYAKHELALRTAIDRFKS